MVTTVYITAYCRATAFATCHNITGCLPTTVAHSLYLHQLHLLWVIIVTRKKKAIVKGAVGGSHFATWHYIALSYVVIICFFNYLKIGFDKILSRPLCKVKRDSLFLAGKSLIMQITQKLNKQKNS